MLKIVYTLWVCYCCGATTPQFSDEDPPLACSQCLTPAVENPFKDNISTIINIKERLEEDDKERGLT